MERNGLLVSELMNVGGRRRRVYKLTKAGKKALGQARAKVDELHDELHEEHRRPHEKIGVLETVAITPKPANVLGDHRTRLEARGRAGLNSG